MSRSLQKRVSKIPGFLGLHRSTVGMLCMVILVGMGERMAERFLPIYLIALGGGALSVGILNGLDNLLSALYAFAGGYLSDRIGSKRALMVFNFIAMCGFLIVIVIPKFQAVLAGAVLFLSWSAISLPATMSLIAHVLPTDKRTMGVSMNSFVRRIPMALGPVLGGICIGIWGEQDGVRIAFIFALVLAGVALILQQRFIEEQQPEKLNGQPDNAPEKNPLKMLPHIGSSLKKLLVSDILVRFCEQIPYAFVVVWSMKIIAEPVTALQFGLLTGIEMTTAMLIYIPVAYFADKSHKKPFVVITFMFFTFFPLMLLFCRSFEWLVLAFILRGLKEFGEPTRKALILDLSPDTMKAGMFGTYYLLRDIFVSLAAFGGAFLWQIGPATNFLVAFGCGIAGTLWFAIKGSDLANG